MKVSQKLQNRKGYTKLHKFSSLPKRKSITTNLPFLLDLVTHTHAHMHIYIHANTKNDHITPVHLHARASLTYL